MTFSDVNKDDNDNYDSPNLLENWVHLVVEGDILGDIFAGNRSFPRCLKSVASVIWLKTSPGYHYAACMITRMARTIGTVQICSLIGLMWSWATDRTQCA